MSSLGATPGRKREKPNEWSPLKQSELGRLDLSTERTDADRAADSGGNVADENAGPVVDNTIGAKSLTTDIRL